MKFGKKKHILFALTFALLAQCFVFQASAGYKAENRPSQFVAQADLSSALNADVGTEGTGSAQGTAISPDALTAYLIDPVFSTEQTPPEISKLSELKSDAPAEEGSDPALSVPLPLGEQIAKFALQFNGYKYVYGSNSPSVGFDCSGLVYYVYGQFGFDLDRTAHLQYTDGVAVKKSELQPGDLVFLLGR